MKISGKLTNRSSDRCTAKHKQIDGRRSAEDEKGRETTGRTMVRRLNNLQIYRPAGRTVYCTIKTRRRREANGATGGHISASQKKIRAGWLAGWLAGNS